MRTEEDSFPIALIHARTILVGLSFTNISTYSGKTYVVQKNPTNENFKNPVVIYQMSAPSH